MTELSFNQKLADKVWANPKFQTAMNRVQTAWLQKAARLADENNLTELEPAKLMQSAAILACSEELEHRHAAFNIATYTYELFGTKQLPLDQALRAVLSRLKNFPSFTTRAEVKNAKTDLPLSLAIEEEVSKAEHKIIVGEKELYLTPFQLKLWNELTAGNNIALTAPTSAGKSFILQNYLLHIFTEQEPCAVIYLVPTRALISQVAKDIEKQFQDFSRERPRIITMALTEEAATPERVIYVLTQERAQLALSSNRIFKADIIIVDEAHNIADGSRGVLLYGVISDLLKRNQQAQILFAGPGIKNLDIFKDTFSLNECVPLPSHEATVGQNFLKIEKIAGERRFIVSEGYKSTMLGSANLSKCLKEGKEMLLETVLHFGKGQANIIYANGAAAAEKYAIELAEKLKAESPTDAQKEKRDELYKVIGEIIHPKYKLAKAMRGGVGFHYGGMPSHIREMVEDAFSEGTIKYLCSTSTLLQGINLPAQNIFMLKPKKGDKPLQSVDFWNLAGRAGRLGKEFQGNIYLIDYEKWKEKPLKQDRETTIHSAFLENIQFYEEYLIKEINGERPINYNPYKPDIIQQTCETVFTRLFTDYQNQSLKQTFQQFSLDNEKQQRLQAALEQAAKSVSIPEEILAKNPTISPRRQQKLFDYLYSEIEQKRSNALITASPKTSGSYDSYSRILKLCQEYILDMHNDSARYIALLCQKWASGKSMPKIINETIKYYEETAVSKELDTIIRETLKTIETEVRFQAVRLFNCYNTLLAYAFEKNNLEKLSEHISSVPAYLELGACDATAINLMSLGLSRHTALKLMKDLFRKSDLDLQATTDQLKSLNIENSDFPKFCIEEVKRIQKNL